jgi:hypothetical protein
MWTSQNIEIRKEDVGFLPQERPKINGNFTLDQDNANAFNRIKNRLTPLKSRHHAAKPTTTLPATVILSLDRLFSIYFQLDIAHCCDVSPPHTRPPRAGNH